MENNRSISTQSIERTTTGVNKEQIKADASHMVGKAKNIWREQIESGKQTGREPGREGANIIEDAASQLKENNLRTFADYISEIKATIQNFCEALQNRSVDEL